MTKSLLDTAASITKRAHIIRSSMCRQ